MSKFAVGDVVKCVNDKGLELIIHLGETYSVSQVFEDIIFVHGVAAYAFEDHRFVLSLPVKQPEIAEPPTEDAALSYLKDGLASYIENDTDDASDYEIGYRAALEDALLDLYGLEVRPRAEFVKAGA